VKPKQTEVGQNEDQQGKKDKSERNKAKQSGTNRVKTKKVGELWVGLCCYSCFTSKVVSFDSTETLKPAVSLFCETTETSLFVSDSVKISFGFFETN
jgi:hypothetical protein